jgi:hypothetical protein
MNIRNRVIRMAEIPASQLRPNPLNWRTHSVQQRDALRGVLAEIGVAGAVLCRQCEDGTLELIDGHLRTEEMGDQPVPCIITDLSGDEAKKLLVVYDPIGDLAGADAGKLNQLLHEIEVQSPALLQMMEELADKHLPPVEQADEPPKEEKPKALKETFHVLVTGYRGEVLSESQQVRILEQLSNEGYDVKALTS